MHNSRYTFFNSNNEGQLLTSALHRFDKLRDINEPQCKRKEIISSAYKRIMPIHLMPTTLADNDNKSDGPYCTAGNETSTTSSTRATIVTLTSRNARASKSNSSRNNENKKRRIQTTNSPKIPTITKKKCTPPSRARFRFGVWTDQWADTDSSPCRFRPSLETIPEEEEQEKI